MKLEIDREELQVLIQLMEANVNITRRTEVVKGKSAHPFYSLHDKVNVLAKKEFGLNYVQLELDLGLDSQSQNVVQ